MGECVRVPGASWCFEGGARLVLILSVLDRVGACGVPSLWVLWGRGDLDAFNYLGGN